MYFPGKRQKSNFDATADATKTNAVAPAAPTTSASVEPTTETTATIPATVGPRIAIVVYSMYGHITKMAEVVRKGIEEAGGSATMFQVPETLPEEVLTKMYAAPKPAFRIITPEELAKYDAFLMGIPTRYGNFPAQWKAFWDSTGGLWASGALVGKYAGAFVSTAGPGGGHIARESDQKSSKTLYIEHIYLPTWTYHRLWKR
ncbi:flavoprotein-like protein [Mycena leptocephala]|nr:flavoprotein-like protein [Mycena leptocephala]